MSVVAALLIALLRVKTVNLSELATAFSGKAHTDSHYKRLQRFFRHYELNYAEIAQAVVALMAKNHGSFQSTEPNGSLGIVSSIS